MFAQACMKMLTGGFSVQILEVPEVVVGRLCLRNLVVWLGLSSMDKIRELESILDEEHWNVVAYHVPITFGSIVLQSLCVSEMHRTAWWPSISAKDHVSTRVPECGRLTLIENPRTSRTVSADPRLPNTVENRTKVSVVREVSVKTLALVYSAKLLCILKEPKAPAPRACTTLSGMRSWSKRLIFSRPAWSSSR